jgi:ribosome-binding factor A
VGRRCGLRYAPELFFEADRSYEQGARIDEILSNVLPEQKEDS